MQPTYLPWIGYFGLINSVDLFVFLNSVQFDKRSWQQRNKIKSPKGSLYLTVPVLSKGFSKQIIKDVKIEQNQEFYKKHINSIKHNYNKSPYYNEFSKKIFELMSNENEYLCDLNIKMIKLICEFLSIKTKTVISSNLKSSGNKSELLSSICLEIGATEYISPLGSKNYLNETDIFQKKNISLKFFYFKHPIYSQLFNKFESNLSVLDLLMNCGNKSLDIIKFSSSIK